MLLVHCLASRVCQKLTFNTFPVVPELSAVMCPRGLGLGRGLSLKAKTKAKDLGPKAKAKAKATAVCPRGASKTRPSPRGHITVSESINQSNTSIYLFNLHRVSITTTHFVFAYNFDACQPIFIIFGRYTLRESWKRVYNSRAMDSSPKCTRVNQFNQIAY